MGEGGSGKRREEGKIFLRNTVLVFLAVLWSVASYLQWAVGDRTTTFQIPHENIMTIEMQQGDVFFQELQINRFIKGLKILTANGGGDRAQINYGTLRFTLRQGDVLESFELDIHGIEDWTYVDFSGALKRFHDGIATLEVKSLDTQQGSSLYIPYTGQDIYEIPAASFNGEPLPGPLCVRYDTGNPQPVAPTAWAVGAALLLAVIAAGIILTKYPKDTLVYAVTVALVFLTICLKYPTYTIDGEAWAEVGSLYIPSAQHSGFFQNLFVLENGLYLNMLGRLITWVSVRCLPTLTGAVLAMDLVGLLLVSMMGSVLATGALRKYVTPLESVWISVLVTTCLVSAETIATPLITGYWGIVPILTLLAVIIFQVEISNKLYWFLGSMVILSTLSRMSFVIFIPILLLVALLQREKLTRRDVSFVALELIVCLFQGIVSLMIKRRSGLALVGGGDLGSIKIGNPLRLLEQAAYAQVQFINTLFRVRNGSFLMWNLLLLAAIFGGSVFLLVCIIKKKHRQPAVFALALLLTSLGNTVMQLTAGFGVPFNGWDAVMDFPRTRAWFFSYIGLFGIVLMLFACLRRSDTWRRERAIQMFGVVMMALGVLIVCSFQVVDGDGGDCFYNNAVETGDWENYSGMASHAAFMIPVAPAMESDSAWYYRSSDCQVQRVTTEKGSNLELDLDTRYAVSLYVHKDTWENQISHPAYYVSVYDRDGNLAATVPQISDVEEEYVGFDLDMPINGISKLEFTHEDGTPAYIAGACLVGYL